MTSVQKAAPRGQQPSNRNSGSYANGPSTGYVGQVAERVVEHRVIIKELPEDATDADLTTHFKQFGEIADVYIPKGKVPSLDL